MDAKSRANFINSIGSGRKIPCPNCDTLNDPDDLFCSNCGTKLIKPAARNEEPVNTAEAPDTAKPAQPAFKQAENTAPAFRAAVKEAENTAPTFRDAIARTARNIKSMSETPKQETVSAPVFSTAAAEPVVEEEPVSVFAQGLPDWDMLPPQVVVRRKKK